MTEVMTEEEPGVMEVHILTTGEFSFKTDLNSWETTVVSGPSASGGAPIEKLDY